MKRTSLKSIIKFTLYHNFKKFWENKHYLKILKLDLFTNFYNVLGDSQITESFGQKIIFKNSVTVVKFKLQQYLALR